MTTIGTRAEYKKIMGNRQQIWRDGCPFCDLENQGDMVLWRWKYWFIIQNKFPYTGTDEHIMAVPYEHHMYATEFSAEVWSELGEVHAWIREYYKPWEKGYFSCTRETLQNKNGDSRSIEHYHIHFLPGQLEGRYLRKMLEHQGFPVKEEGVEMKVCN